LKNKIDALKKDYIFFMEFKNLTTGLGWDEAKPTVDCSDEWWDENLAVSGIIELWFFPLIFVIYCALLILLFI
jgi:hypothetical protein